MQKNKKIVSAVKNILQYLSIKNPLEKCEVIFLMGGASIIPAQKAAELFFKGWGKKIVFVSLFGKFSNPEWKEKGGDSGMFHEELVRLGVPETTIIYTPHTTNTLEEVCYGKLFLEQHHLDTKKIIVVSRPFHQRRVCATWNQQYPEIQIINCPGDESYEITESLLTRLIGEIDRLLLYAEKGDITHQEIPQEVQDAYDEIKKFLE